jgi:hypothetical protein
MSAIGLECKDAIVNWDMMQIKSVKTQWTREPTHPLRGSLGGLVAPSPGNCRTR